MKCGTIVPRQHDVIGERDDGYLAECILERNHLGKHMFTTPEGISYEWEDDASCGCCDGETDEPCYVFWRVE
jgi:hypothetical protein